MEQNRNKRKAKWRPRQVKCLGCGLAFRAESPFLRVCALCKESEEWQSGDCDIALHPVAANDNNRQ